MTARWGVNDPSAVEGSEAVQLAAFHKAFRELESRIRILCSISIASLDRMRLKERVDEIGRFADTSADQP